MLGICRGEIWGESLHRANLLAEILQFRLAGLEGEVANKDAASKVIIILALDKLGILFNHSGWIGCAMDV